MSQSTGQHPGAMISPSDRTFEGHRNLIAQLDMTRAAMRAALSGADPGFSRADPAQIPVSRCAVAWHRPPR